MERPKTVIISAYRDFSIRYILYSDILPTLLAQVDRVVILVKEKNVDYYRRRFPSPKIDVESVQYVECEKSIKKSTIGRQFTLLRKCFSGKSADLTNETDDSRILIYRRELLKSSVFQRSLFRIVVAGAHIARRHYWFRQFIVRVEGILFPGRNYDDLIRRVRPGLVITSSLGYMIDPLLMRAAKRHGVKTAAVIHSWDNTSTKDYRGADPDHVVVWNQIMAREAEVFHDVPKERIFVGGIAHWDRYFTHEEGEGEKTRAIFKEIGLASNRPLIYYCTSSFKIFNNSLNTVSEIVDGLQTVQGIQRPQLLVRLHPSYLIPRGLNNETEVAKLIDKISLIRRQAAGDVFFDEPRMPRIPDGIDMPIEDMLRHKLLLKSSSILVNEYSTLMIEGAIFDIPTINISVGQFRDTDKEVSYLESFRHIKRVLETNACVTAYSYLELLEWIRRYLITPELHQEHRESLVAQEISTNIGRAGTVVGHHLAGLTQEGLCSRLHCS